MSQLQGAGSSNPSAATISALNFASLGWGATVSGVTYSSIHIENAGSGDVDLFTVPANSRALIFTTFYNTAGTTTTYFQEFNDGAYKRLGTNATILTNVSANVVFAGLILEAGQKFALNTSQAGLNIFGTAVVFPNTERLRSVLTTSLASGDNTIYTCPANKTAIFATGNTQWLGVSTAGFLGVLNASGGSLNYKANAVSAAGSPGTANQYTANATAIANNTLAFIGATMQGALSAGAFINLNTSGVGTQYAWVTVFEN